MNPAEYPYTGPGRSVSTPKPAPRPAPTYSAFVPVFMILVILILSSLTDVVSLIKHKKALRAQKTQAMAPLHFAGKQAEFVESLHQDLVKVAPSDPAAAAILTQFFPPPTTLPNPEESNKNSDPKIQE